MDKAVSQVRGITEADLQKWRHHPVTQVLLQYLQDYQVALREAALGYLLASNRDGPFNTEYTGEIAGRIKAIDEVSNLPFSAIQQFYQKEEDNAREPSNEDGTGDLHPRDVDGDQY